MNDKAYNVLNKTLTDKFGNEKIKNIMQISAVSTLVVTSIAVAKANPVLRTISNIGIGITTAIGAVDIVSRTNNYMNNEVHSDPDNGTGVLDKYKDMIFNTTSRKEEVANG